MLPGRCLVLAIAALACASAPVHAQGAWDAILSIDPYPSPYYSDWDNDPNIATLTVINTTTSAQQVRIHFNVTNHANRMVVSGTSDAQTIGAGATVIFDNPYDVAGSTHRDEEEEGLAAKTGRLREGEYLACAVITDLSGFSLAESCAPFTIVHPDPPLLLAPDNGEVLIDQSPLFQWTPVQVPVDFQLSYVVRVVEVLEGQTAQEALRSNIPHFQSLDEQFPNLRYPIDARPFEIGKQYAWTVQVLDQNGYAAASNDGQSEIWTFAYGEQPAIASADNLTVQVVNLHDSAVERPTPGAPEEDGFAQICLQWGQRIRGRVDLNLMTPFAFPGFIRLQNTQLVRMEQSAHDNRRVWAVWGNNENRMVMLSGQCVGTATELRWVGFRRSDDTQELAGWLPGDTEVATEAPGPTLKFGVAIFSLFEETAGGDEAIAPVREFLEDREIDVKPGINLVGVLDAKYLPIWDFLESIGHDANTAEIELQGFAGLNVNASAELRGGTEEATASLGATTEYITFRASMPERHFDGPVKSTRVSLEFAFGDSLGVAAKRDLTKGDTAATRTTDYSHHLALKLIVDAVTRNDITWTGALEWDWNLSDEEGQCFTCAAPTLRLTTDHKWPSFEGADLAVGNPEIAIAINDGFKKFLRSRDTDSLHADITFRGSLIWHDEDVAKLAVTFGRRAANAESMQRTDARIKAAQLLDSIAVAETRKAEARGDSAAVAAWRQKHRHHVEDIGLWKAQLREDSLQVARTRQDHTTKAPAAAQSDKGMYWKASLTLGNMGLGNFIDLMHSAALAIAARSKP